MNHDRSVGRGIVLRLSVFILFNISLACEQYDAPPDDIWNDGGLDERAKSEKSGCAGKCSSSCRCGWTEIGCRSDGDCQSGLYCKMRPQLGNRCLKKPTSNDNNSDADCHIYKPGNEKYCTSSCRCKEGEGDCDNDSECKSGLVCKQQSGTDHCVKPEGGGGSSGGESGQFIVTSVRDDLDNNDGALFVNGYRRLGYTLKTWNKDVSTSQLMEYLGQSVDFVYHTGHGDNGSIATRGGTLSVGNVNKVQARHTVFATCLTLKSTSWKNKFGPNAETIMGYTKVSYDYTDNTVVNRFINYIKNGTSVLKAWYKTNNAIGSLDDRWAAYAREGGAIVEYSARSGRSPKLQTGNTVHLYNKIEVAARLYDNPVKFDGPLISATLNPREQLYQDEDRGSWPTEATSLDEDDAHSIAWKALSDRGGVPEQAELDSITPVEKCDYDVICYDVGFQVRFVHKYKGLALRSNGIADYITVLVDDSGARSIDHMWSHIVEKQNLTQPKPMSSTSALSLAAEKIDLLIRGNALFIINIVPVYGVVSENDGFQTLVPAFEIIGSNDEEIIVNAINGELVF